MAHAREERERKRIHEPLSDEFVSQSHDNAINPGIKMMALGINQFHSQDVTLHGSSFD